jgi:hypothetical protein
MTSHPYCSFQVHFGNVGFDVAMVDERCPIGVLCRVSCQLLSCTKPLSGTKRRC